MFAGSMVLHGLVLVGYGPNHRLRRSVSADHTADDPSPICSSATMAAGERISDRVAVVYSGEIVEVGAA